MGYNSTLIVLNDSLHVIENDKNFGNKVARAIGSLTLRSGPIDLCVLGHANAATVIETHHADQIKLIAIGGNYGQDLGYHGDYRSEPIDMLKSLADSLGYRIVKKSKG